MTHITDYFLHAFDQCHCLLHIYKDVPRSCIAQSTRNPVLLCGDQYLILPVSDNVNYSNVTVTVTVYHFFSFQGYTSWPVLTCNSDRVLYCPVYVSIINVFIESKRLLSLYRQCQIKSFNGRNTGYNFDCIRKSPFSCWQAENINW